MISTCANRNGGGEISTLWVLRKGNINKFEDGEALNCKQLLSGFKGKRTLSNSVVSGVLL
jgi:hypothetical protein